MATVATLAVEVMAKTEQLEKGALSIMDRLDNIASVAINVSEKLFQAITLPFIAGAKGVAAFANETANAIEGLNRMADAAAATGKRITELIGRYAQFATKLPVGNAITSTLNMIASAMKVIITVGMGVAAVATAVVFWQRQHLIWAVATSKTWGGMIKRLELLGAAWLKAFTTKTVDALGSRLALLIGKLMVISGIAGGILFLGMAASVESAQRQILGLVGATTPLQDALAKIAEAWRLWTDFVVGDFINIVGTGLGAMASVLVEIISTIRFINDTTGGWLKTIATLAGSAMTVYAAWKLIAYLSSWTILLWKTVANSSFLKPVIAGFSLLWKQIWAVNTAQASLNTLTFTYIKTQAGILAVAVANKIGAIATWIWAAAQTALNVAMTYFLALSIVGLVAVAAATAAAAAYTASYTSRAESASAASTAFADSNRQLAASLDAAGRSSAATLERLKELADFSKQMNFDALDIKERDNRAQQKITDSANVKDVGTAAIGAIVDKEIVPLKAAIAKTETLIKSLGYASNQHALAQAKELKQTLDEYKKQLEDAETRLKQTQEAVKNAKPLEEAAQTLAHKKRIEANLKELNIDVIRSAEETYAQRLKNLETALAQKWISLEQFNRQTEAATKAFQDADPATRARIEAEKKLTDSLQQAARSISDSLKTPWLKYAEQAQLIDNLLKSQDISSMTAADADTKNRQDLKAAVGFADIKSPSQLLADRLFDLARITKELGTSEIQVQKQFDKLADDVASAAGIGDLFGDLHENRVKSLAKAFEGIEALAAMGKITESVAADLKDKAARKFLKNDQGETKGPELVVKGTTEAYQRDQEVKREANQAQKQLEELQKLKEEAELSRREQEESRRFLERIEENTAGLRNVKTAGV